MLEKTLRVSRLYDFYYGLLTQRQCKYVSLYYMEDYSLGEISELYQVSRQAVHDTLKRTEDMLEDFESRLPLLSKYQERSRLLDDLRDCISEKPTTAVDDIYAIITAMETLEDR